jgi:hypothetical protein
MYLTIDSLITGILIISVLVLFVPPEPPSFGEVIVYSQLQDLMEVCTLNMDFTSKCFSSLKQKVPGITYAVYINGKRIFGPEIKKGITVERRYLGKHVVIIGY